MRNCQKRVILLVLTLALIIMPLCGCRLIGGLLKQPAASQGEPIQGGPVEPEFFTVSAEPGGTAEQTVTEEEVRKALLPSSYDARQTGKELSIRNQGNQGTCWAFAALGVLEALLLPEKVQFSVDHLVANNGFEYTVNEGGNTTMALAYLAAWKGPVLEADDPYGDGATVPDAPVRYHLQQAEYLSQDLDAIKEAILRYGAVSASLFADKGILQPDTTTEYYDAKRYTYCYMGSNVPNHDVILVGWDDDYPKENFLKMPPFNGAFLCQNSWGADFGDNGYFYVSYYDSNIQNHVLSYERLDPLGVYDSIYQYDELGMSAQVGYQSSVAWGANVFTAKAEEELTAVSLTTTVPGTRYEVYLKVISSTDTTPLEERLMIGPEDVPVAYGTLPRVGYYTVDLAEPVPLTADDRFAVIVRVEADSTVSPLAADLSDTPKTPQTSFLSGDGFFWTDAGKDYHCVICIKAFTKELKNGK